MSSYIHFFIRVKDEFAHIRSFSRSSYIYQNFNWLAPYEKIAPASKEQLEDGRDSLQRQKRDLEDAIIRINKKIARINELEGSIPEKLEAISKLEDEQDSIEYELREIEYAENFVQVLLCSVDERKYSKEDYVNGEYVDIAGVPVRENEYIYVGVDCGSVVSVQDIASFDD